MVAASCDGVAMANAEARQLASSDVTQAILPPESRACRAVPRGAALVVAQPDEFRAGCVRRGHARIRHVVATFFLIPRSVLDLLDPRSLNTRNLRVSLHGHQWWTDGWPQLRSEPPKIEARRKVPRGAASATAPPAASWWRETCTRDFTARGSDLSHTPLRAGPPASMISRGGPGCSSFRRSGPGRPSLSLRSKACGVVVLVVAWAARDAARAVACATARAGTAGRWARTKERVGGGL